MTALPSFGLRTRLTLLVLVLGAVLAAVALAGLRVVLDQQLDAAVDDELRARAADVAGETVSGGGEVLNDSFAQVVDRSGAVTARSATAPTRPVLTSGQLAAARTGPITVERVVPALRGDARLRAEPAGSAVVVVGSSLAEARGAAGRLETVLSGLLVGVVVGAAVVTWLVVGGALRPVGRMADAADRISGHDDVARLPVPGGRDEIAGLATTLNRLLDRLAASFERESAFVDDASHELRTPLTVLRGELELALDDPDPSGVQRGIRVALAEATRLSTLADDLLVLARERSGGLALDRRRTHLLPWVETVAMRLQPALRAQLRVVGDDVVADVDRQHLERVLVNTIGNAVAAGSQHVEVRVGQTADSGGVRLGVLDDGPGFPPDLIPRALDRFSRGDLARHRSGAADAGSGGAGLGLAIVAAVVRAHGGTVTVGNGGPLGGALVTIDLPAPA